MYLPVGLANTHSASASYMYVFFPLTREARVYGLANTYSSSFVSTFFISRVVLYVPVGLASTYEFRLN